MIRALALHLDDRQRRPLEHVEVGERAERACGLELLETLELAGLREDVDRSSRHRNGTPTFAIAAIGVNIQ